jgi:hypothetical protein
MTTASYFSTRFLIGNIVRGLGKTGVNALVSEVMDPAKSAMVTPEMIRELARRITHERLETTTQLTKDVKYVV